MEYDPFSWVLDLVHSSGSSLAILDCYCISSVSSPVFYSQNPDGSLISQDEEGSILKLLTSIYKSYQLANKLGLCSNLVCSFMINSRKYKVDSDEMELFLCTSNIPDGISIIQIPKPSTHRLREYTITTEYSPSGYRTAFYTIFSSRRTLCKDQILAYQALHIIKKLVALIREIDERHIMLLEVELMEDIDGALWISHIQQLLMTSEQTDDSNLSVCEEINKSSSTNLAPAKYPKTKQNSHVGRHSRMKTEGNSVNIGTLKYTKELAKRGKELSKELLVDSRLIGSSSKVRCFRSGSKKKLKARSLLKKNPKNK